MRTCTVFPFAVVSSLGHARAYVRLYVRAMGVHHNICKASATIGSSSSSADASCLRGGNKEKSILILSYTILGFQSSGACLHEGKRLPTVAIGFRTFRA
eukprot:4175354-Amphidinium_carterae.1